MPKSKITIFGAGNVGSTAAEWLLSKELGDIMLIDRNRDKALGKALDLSESIPALETDVKISGSGDFSDSAGSDIILLTAGIPRKEGMRREDLLQQNKQIIEAVVPKLIEYSPNACLVVVTNPVEVMSYLSLKLSGLRRFKVIGMGNLLDSNRFAGLIANKLNVYVKDVNALVVGEHGSGMLPLINYSSVGGTPVSKLLSRDDIDDMIKRVKIAGEDIINLSGASAYHAPGASASKIIETILRGKRSIMPTVAYLDGEYGEKDVYMGVQAMIGENGIEKIIEVEMTDEEKAQFRVSADKIRASIKTLSPI